MNKAFELPTLKCLRCGHKWMPRQPKEPKTCPKCRSPYWNKPKWKGVKKIEIRIPIADGLKVEMIGKPVVRTRAELYEHMYEVCKEHKNLAKRIVGTDLRAEIKESMVSIIFAYTCLEAYINTLGKDKLRDKYDIYWAPLRKWNEVAFALAKEVSRMPVTVFEKQQKPFSSFVELNRIRGKLIHHKAKFRKIAKTKYGPTEGTINWVNYDRAEWAFGVVREMVKKLYDSIGSSCPDWLKED